MPVTSVHTDPASLTMTVVAEFPVPVSRLWDAYADPRQIERFWGPPTYPATFARHDMHVPGRSSYWMTGPEGDVSRGFWEFQAVQAGRSFEVIDGFAQEDGEPNEELPTTRMVFTFEPTEAGSKVTTTTRFNSLDDLEKLTSMGMEEGMREAASQMDAVLADLATFAAGQATEAQILSDTRVRISRIVRGSVEQVWRAHNEVELVKRWLLGPDGWTMPVCELAAKVGDTYRYEWEQEGGGERFGFTGELLESVEPSRSVTTERMIGTEGPSTVNEMTLTPVAEGTLLSLVVTYPSAEVRDMILATGMTDGMETSYARLEEQVLVGV